MTTDKLAGAVDATLRDGGGTFDARTFEPVAPVDGYAVGIHDGTYATVYPDAFGAHHDLALLIGRAAEYALANGARHVGTWIADGIVHVDPVGIYQDRTIALGMAAIGNQRAIYSFADGESINVDAAIR